jgi:magnesium-transporting ATPase (P-type)
MSVEPSWSSTMFPVIYAVNQFLTCFAFCLALFLFIAGRPPFASVMRPKFQLDMGTLLLAFTLFWSYTSFSQFMLIWIGNLPEEIPFYLKRSAGGWWYVSAGLIALHFALPFLLLLFRDVKLHPQRLRAVAIYLLVICAIDVTWWVEPVLAKKSGSLFWLMDVGALAGIGGVFALVFFAQLKGRPIIAANETFLLPEGHHHEHH